MAGSLRRWRPVADWLALWFAATVFVWMFLSSDGVARTVADEQAIGVDARSRQRVAEFADNWRHGLVGSPVFVPGFLLTTAAVAVCHRRRPMRTVAAMVVSAIVIGLATAWPLGRVGTEYVAAVVHAKLGITVAGPLASGGRGVFAAMATFAIFAVLVVTCRHCVHVRDWRPLAIPTLGYLGLAALRGGGVKFGHLSSIWASRAWNGDATAIVSTMVVIGLTVAVLVDAARTCSSISAKDTPAAARLSPDQV
jgi:hypothetical protein